MLDVLRHVAKRTQRSSMDIGSTRGAASLARLGLFSFLLLATVPAYGVDLVGQTSATLGWTAASGPVAGYSVFVSRNGSVPANPEQRVTATAATISGAAGDSLVVWVQAYDATQQPGPDSPRSDTIRFVAAPAVPTPPSVPGNNLAVSTVQGTSPSSQQITIPDAGTGYVYYSVSSSVGWILPSPVFGLAISANDRITLGFSTSTLEVGSYTGFVTVTNIFTRATRTTTVVLTVAPLVASVSAEPASLFASTPYGHAPPARSFTLRRTLSGTSGYVIVSDTSWLVPYPTSGTLSGETDTIGVYPQTERLSPGPHSGTLRVYFGGSAALTVSVTVQVRPPTGDFDADGVSDLSYWSRSAGSIISFGHLFGPELTIGVIQGLLPDEWELLLSGDFDADGASDLLWRSRESGRIGVCLMLGASFKDCGAPLDPPLSWVLLGSADFDGDGHSDVAFRDPATGAVEVCFMAGLLPSFCAEIASFPPTWRVTASGDHNADGYADLVAQDPASQTLQICSVAGPASGSCTASPDLPDADVVATGDYDGDGRADLLWRTRSSPSLSLGLQVGQPSARTIPLGTIPSGAELVGSLDLDGNGKSEILVRNPVNGSTTLWLSNALGVFYPINLGSVGTDATLCGSTPIQ
jgi:hypothetical protein